MGKASQIPHLRKTKTSAQLIVHGEPFLMLSAELHNSTLSSAKYMCDDAIWVNMKAMHINTLLGSVSWEMIEPEEGKFDFANLNEVILDARRHGMKLVLLWFGSFKNALSTYAPAWVKKDVKRFPRVHVSEAGAKTRTLELLSPFCEAAWEADARAFAALCRHLREFDAWNSTVVMLQVENETGLLGDSRDRSKIAEKRFREPVPSDLLQHRRSAGNLHHNFKTRFPNWQEKAEAHTRSKDLFGYEDEVHADEMFMANAFSRDVGKVAAAGKAEYPIPFYANVWLNFDDPSALDLADIPVVYNAPALDFIAPDLYFRDYEGTCRNYRHDDQPLFIPEQWRDEKGARRVWLAYGSYLALGCSPFGIDSVQAIQSPVTKHFRLIHSVRKQILDAQAHRPEDMMGFFFDEWADGQKVKEKGWTKKMGEFTVIVERAFVFGKPGPGAGMVIHQSHGRFLCIGWGFNVSFQSTNPKSTFSGILHVEEKEVNPETCELTTLKVLGGDETRSGAFLIMPNEDPDYGGFPIAVTIPSRTMIAECWAYSLEEDEQDV